MTSVESPNISANAGDEKALSDPNSPESIARRSKQAQAQSSADQQYDAPAPKAGEAFTNYVIVWDNEQKRSREITSGLFLALGILLFLYKAAPDSL